MKLVKFVSIITILLLVGCFGPSRDTELETKISKLVKAEEIVAINSFGQVVVNISSQTVFEMEQEARQKLAEQLANAALEMHADSSAIMIGFGRVTPEVQQIAYAWKNENGKLTPIAQ